MKVSKLLYFVVVCVVLSACGGGGGADAAPGAAEGFVRNSGSTSGGGAPAIADFNAPAWGGIACTGDPFPHCPPPPLGTSAGLPELLRYEITYLPYDAKKGSLPSIAVAAPAPRSSTDPLYISPTSELQRVEVLPFGMESQTLTQVNAWRGAIELPTYLFELPIAFDSDPYPCGTGRYKSEARITLGDGTVHSSLFEICPGTPFTLDVTAP